MKTGTLSTKNTLIAKVQGKHYLIMSHRHQYSNSKPSAAEILLADNRYLFMFSRQEKNRQSIRPDLN
jgi:hypothetical protein